MTHEVTIAEVGEEGLLRRLQPILARHTREFPLATGDDVAVTPPLHPGRRLVWTIDSMIEGTHFRWWNHPAATARALGRKLAMSNLSDLAAKGADPAIGLLSLGIPGSARLDDVEAFMSGVADTLEEYGACLAGGDTVMAPVWAVTLSLTGSLDIDQPIAARDRVRPGHHVYITGNPGEGAAGFNLLEQRIDTSTDPGLSKVVQRHLSPTARVAMGKLLLRFTDIAMMDVSDGVAHDAATMARLSKVAIVLEQSALPLSVELQKAASILGMCPRKLLLHGGEDYELIFTTAAPVEEVLGTDPLVRRVGFARPGQGVFLSVDNSESPLIFEGFEHFSHGAG